MLNLVHIAKTQNRRTNLTINQQRPVEVPHVPPSGASLKLSILNPKGRIWTMVAGGGKHVSKFPYHKNIHHHVVMYNTPNLPSTYGCAWQIGSYSMRTISYFCLSVHRVSQDLHTLFFRATAGLLSHLCIPVSFLA